jgi:predicted ATP-dependent protease
MKLNAENVRSFFGFLCAFCKKENIRSLDSTAVAKVLEHACRITEEKNSLSTQFGILADVIREADYWATLENSESITAAHVRKALDSKVYRCSRVQERLQELMLRGTILMSTSGTSAGTVNALSVVDMGDYVFGRPSKITASIGPGRSGIVDIEREVKLGGPIHSKGVLILGGYLTQRYAQEAPLSLSCKLVFEQSYSSIEGDSASSAELCALLSALSGLHASQGIAITGSVNQFGELQAIGGVNEKIEGFFDLCRARGLDGNQGVIIPQSNIQNLMLREDVQDAVRANSFHVWAVTSIDQAMEILTGTPAGDRTLMDKFPPHTVNYLVEHRLGEMAQCLGRLEANRAGVPHEIG